MENGANDSNQNHVDGNNLKGTLSEKLEITTKEESDVVNIDFQHGDSIDESEVFTFPTQPNGHADRSHSTSPSKQRVIDTINEVISDHLPVETQDESIQEKVPEKDLPALDDDSGPVSVPTGPDVGFEQSICKSPSESYDDGIENIKPEKPLVKPVENHLNDDVVLDDQTNLRELKENTLHTVTVGELTSRDSPNEALSPEPSPSMESDKVDLEAKLDSDVQSTENNILHSKGHPEDIENTIKDFSASVRSESNTEKLGTPAVEKLADKQMVENNEEPAVDAIPELEKCSSEDVDVSDVVEKTNEEPVPEWLDMLGNGLLKKKVNTVYII